MISMMEIRMVSVMITVCPSQLSAHVPGHYRLGPCCCGQLLLSSYPHYLIITIMGEVGVDRVISRASKMDIAIELWV